MSNFIRLSTLACTLGVGCSTSILLGAPDAGRRDAGSGMDAAFDVLPDSTLDSGFDSGFDSGVAASSTCGFRFEHRAQSPIAHIWADGPNNQWTIGGYNEVRHFDGTRTRRVPLPEEIEAERHYIWAMEGSLSGPWLLVDWRPSDAPQRHRLLSWNGNEWDEIQLPEALRLRDGRLAVELAVLGDDDVWVAGATEVTDSVGSRIYHWNGEGWSEHVLDGEHVFGLTRLSDTEVMVGLEAERVLTDGQWTLHFSFLRGSNAGFRPLTPRPEFFNMGARMQPVYHASAGESELWTDNVGRVWNGSMWQATHTSPGDESFLMLEHEFGRIVGSGHRSVVGVGYFEGAYWIVKKDVAIRIIDPARPMEFTVHMLPFSPTDVVFPDSGPPWIVGTGTAFWNGREWLAQGDTEHALYTRFGGVWGSSPTDYYVWGQPIGQVTHVRDGLIEYPSPPDDDTASYHVFGLAADDLFFFTSSGTQRFYDGAFQEVVHRHGLRMWGSDESRLYALGGNSALLKFDGDAFVPVADEVWMPPGTTEAWQSGLVATDAVTDELYMSVRLVTSGGTGADDYRGFMRLEGETWSLIPMPADGGFPTEIYAADGRLYMVGLYGEGWATDSRISWWEDGEWTHYDLDTPTRSPHIGGGGDEVWVMSTERTIWRLRAGDVWERDDRCSDSRELSGVFFEGLWFPPNGPPKMFGYRGNVLVYEEELPR